MTSGVESSLSELLRECRGECSRCAEKALQKLLREKGYADFDVLRVEAYVEAPLVNEEPLHVGAGAEPLTSPIDLSILRVRRRLPNGDVIEEPVIPGSSLKGVLRSYVEAYAASRGMLEPLVQLGDRALPCTGESLSEVEKFLRSELCKYVRDGAKAKIVDEVLYPKCLASPVVGLFGAPWLASHIKLFDARPEVYPVTISTVARVAIDRFTGAQSPGLLYTMEYVEPGYRWKFRMSVFNITPGDKQRWELIRFMFSALERGVTIGRRTSAGMGLVKLNVDEGRVKLLRVTRDGLIVETLGLREWIEGGWYRG